MDEAELQTLCERGQQELMETRYLDAATTLVEVERLAWDRRAFDTLSRLYLPLQEARRQIRQRCGEGVVRMHILAAHPDLFIATDEIVTNHTQGQLLVAGWGSIQPAIQVRHLSRTHKLYLETFLAAMYPMTNGEPVVVIVPQETADLPAPTPRSADELRLLLPLHHLLLQQSDLPADAATGNSQTFAGVMALWERLHIPFLLAAAEISDPFLRMQAYRQTLQVDPACELAHQFLADIARAVSRGRVA